MLIDEGIIPMGFNFQQAKQNVQYNSMINMNDPIVNAEMKKRAERDRLSAIAQKQVYDKQLSRSILEKCLQSVDNLIKGNSHKGFNHTDSIILLNSIQNKCTEILNESARNINNKILMEQAKTFKMLYQNQYIQDATRYKLENSGNTIAYNTNEGIVKFNPNGLFDIVTAWCYNNQSHQRYDDILINE